MKKNEKEFFRFLVAGLSAVGADLFIYFICLNFFSYDLAKIFSFLSGSIVAFVTNKYWTFGKYERNYKEVLRFGLLYITTLVVNIITNKFTLEATDEVFFAFLLATGVSTVLNFIGQKWWVFK
jgi:putative flippase GtrA